MKIPSPSRCVSFGLGLGFLVAAFTEDRDTLLDGPLQLAIFGLLFLVVALVGAERKP